MKKKILIVIGSTAIALYSLICLFLFFRQERILFRPQRLPTNYAFDTSPGTDYSMLPMKDGTKLCVLHVKADSPKPKGVIIYLHGNGGALDTWVSATPLYAQLGYDVIMPDYRGYGKSEGAVTHEQQLYDDVQEVYDLVRKQWHEDKITLLGYSLGTGLATWLAAHNHPGRLLLLAPYYSMTDLMSEHYPWAPTFLLKYKLPTCDQLPKVSCPITLFHGDEDRVVNCSASERLSKLFKPGDRFILLPGQGHGGITDNKRYVEDVTRLLK